MTSDKVALLAICGAIYQLPAEDRAKVEAAAEKIRKIRTEAGDYGDIAVALVGAEIAAKE